VFADLVEKAAGRLAEELDAEETKFFAHQGEVKGQVNVTAHDIRLRALDLVLKRFRRPERTEVRGKFAHVHLVNPPTDFRKTPEVIDVTPEAANAS